MPVEIRVPQIAESIVEATISRWLKHEGDPVAVGDVLAELATDKVNVEVYAENSGVLSTIKRQEGETVNVNDVIAVVSEQNGATAPTPSAASETAVQAAAPVESQSNGRPKAATPVAQKLAEEKGLDLNSVPGSGPGGKVLKEDVAKHLERALPSGPTPVAAQPAPVAVAPPQTLSPPPSVPSGPLPTLPAHPLPSLFGRPESEREERIRMSRRRQTIAHRLKEALNTAAMLTTFNEVDMGGVMEVRKRRRDAFKERHGVGLGFMSFFTKAVVGALKAFPYLNAEIQGDEIILKHYYDIGIAVGAQEGLVVPVLRNTDSKTFAQIEKEIVDLAGRAKENKLTLPELQGGTFTITNGGIFGSLMSTPILNAPQVGILGMHKIQERPIAVNGEVVIRPMMYLALSYDHRIVDGSEAVRFLVRVKELIEDPETLLLEG